MPKAKKTSKTKALKPTTKHEKALVSQAKRDVMAKMGVTLKESNALGVVTANAIAGGVGAIEAVIEEASDGKYTLGYVDQKRGIKVPAAPIVGAGMILAANFGTDNKPKQSLGTFAGIGLTAPYTRDLTKAGIRAIFRRKKSEGESSESEA